MKALVLAATTTIIAAFAPAALAADIGIRTVTPQPAIQVPIAPTAKTYMHDWSGTYIGAHIGHGWGDHRFDTSLFDQGVSAPRRQDSFLSRGMLYGLQIGANHQYGNNLVVGLEADLSYADIKGSFNYDNGRRDAFSGSTFDVMSTVRGRIGYAFDNFLPYATGGIALGHSRDYVKNLYSPADEYSSSSAFSIGWTAGAGLEYAVDKKLSLKAEYLYTSFPNISYWMPLPAPASSARINDDASFHALKLGVNWKLQ